MSETAASIMLVDDHPLLRKGLRQLLTLSGEMEVVAEASNGKDAIKLASELDPDLILLDLNMQGMDGLETLRHLRDEGVTSRIVMLTVSDADEDVLSAISAGADGYLLKDMEPEDMLVQIERALSGALRNFPIRPVGWLLWMLVFPWGRRAQEPSDRLGRRAAALKAAGRDCIVR